MPAAYEKLRKAVRGKATPGSLKGPLRPHTEALALDVIDSRVRALVAVFNVDGVVSSVSSCEGHRLWCLPTRRTPFVMFCTDVARAARLADRILLDHGQGCELQHYWRIDATFNADGGLVFSLHCPDQRFNRRKLDADILRLTQWVRDVFQNQPAEHARSLD
ncbi:hypothetical protein [Achromobacter kerstersii]|uniref:Uncharacterized protein n=1 Tax=Achromobacter kerstersii TaxID=1353890 RepID=A0A6S7AT65_9BURK|nr:hypothetical protein [Achromobacter kerstersii]CAB3743728.1 hypothetical protein LMG3441_06042 [Achromobacter kerstersii]